MARRTQRNPALMMNGRTVQKQINTLSVAGQTSVFLAGAGECISRVGPDLPDAQSFEAVPKRPYADESIASIVNSRICLARDPSFSPGQFLPDDDGRIRLKAVLKQCSQRNEAGAF